MNPPQPTTTVWGVDPSTTRVAFGATTGKTLSVDFPKHLTGAERLTEARTATWYAARQFAEDNLPLCVWMEQPGGKHPNRPLIQMVGVISEAIYAALRTLYRHPVTIYPIAVASWKKAAVGRGDARKEEVAEWAELERARLGFARPDNQDECDSLAIAFAGQSMIREEAA